MTLPLSGTSNPLLVVPDTSEYSAAMKTKSLQRNTTKSIQSPQSDGSTTSNEANKVGHSIFYDCIDASPAAGIEKQDDMKPEKNDTDEEGSSVNETYFNWECYWIEFLKLKVSDIDQGCTIFSGVTYLGAANINAPKSEIDIYRIMSELNSGSSSAGLKISISIPNCSEGLVL